MTLRKTWLVIFSLAILTVFNGVQSENSQIIYTDDRLCAIHRDDFGRIERVQLTSRSINVRFKNPFYNLNCPSIRIDAYITDSYTTNLHGIIEDIRTDTFYVEQLISNRNYSIEIRIADGITIRTLPTYVFETLQSSNTDIVTLTNADLLIINQIESFLFPQTHLYLVTVPFQIRRATILANVTLSYGANQQNRIVRPVGSGVVSRLSPSKTTKTLAFTVDLPRENVNTTKYSSRLQLFFADDQRQSIIDHLVSAQFPSPITADFLPPLANDDLGRSVRVNVNHLCSTYLEVKATVLSNLSANAVVSRAQCDIGKNTTSRDDITHGRCSLLFDKLRPEQIYSLSIRATCQFSSPSSLFVFYDQPYSFPFKTPTGLPDDSSLKLSFHTKNRTLSWVNNATNTTYLGPQYRYELFARSNDTEGNWTLIYLGNQTHFQIESRNATYRLYMANQHGRQVKNYSEIEIDGYLISTPPSKTTGARIVIFTVLASLSLLVVCGVIFAGCYLRNRKLYGKLKKKYCGSATVSDKELEHLRSLTYGSSTHLLKDNILYTWNHTPTTTDLDKLPKIERNAIKLERLIGRGAFGEVYAGSMMDKKCGRVAVKTLLSSASSIQRLDFVKEAIIMNQFDHEHIVRLLGVCLKNQFDQKQPQFLVLELMEQGDLQNYLRRARPLLSSNKNNGECQLTYDDCLDIARQIADGACYLEQHSYVHRDLAARNCLVSSAGGHGGELTVKIGDFGLARMLSQQDYYRKTGEALLPVRWMAPESLLDALFTSHSDIWSFGIVLWEIVTLGQVPYSTLNNQQVISLITSARGTLDKPSYCTQDLYELMLSCWRYTPENRIDFVSIHSRLTQLLVDEKKEQPSLWFPSELSLQSARGILDCVLNNIEPPAPTSSEGSDEGECRSSTSGCFSSMTESTTSPLPRTHHHQLPPPYRLRLIDDTTSSDYYDDDDRSDIGALNL